MWCNHSSTLMHYYHTIGQCPPHTNSSNGFVAADCQNCSEGYYQLHYGSTFCVPCLSDDKKNSSFNECYGKLNLVVAKCNCLCLSFYFVSIVTPEPLTVSCRTVLNMINKQVNFYSCTL